MDVGHDHPATEPERGGDFGCFGFVLFSQIGFDTAKVYWKAWNPTSQVGWAVRSTKKYPV